MIVFYSIIMALVYALGIFNLNIVKLRKCDVVILMVIQFIISVIALSYMKIIGAPLNIIIMALYLSKINKKYFKNIMAVLLMNIIVFISDIVSGITILFIFNLTKDQLINNTKLYVLLHILVLLFSFILSKLLAHILNENKINKADRTLIKIILANLLTAFIMIYIVGMIYKYSDRSITILVLNLALLIIYFILVAYVTSIYVKSVKKEIEFKYKEKEMKQLQEYISMVEVVNLDIRKFKHDYLNILSTINYYVDSKDFDGFVKYFNESIMPESDDIRRKNISFNNLKNIKISPIKGLLSYKIGRAQKNDVDVTVDILEEIESVNINIVDLARIIGILLDNAIEEARMCEDKLIKINIINAKQSKIFVIANTCRSELPPIYIMKEKGFSTKGENRGVGLSNVHEIIYNQYDNVTLNTWVEEDIFTQELIIEE